MMEEGLLRQVLEKGINYLACLAEQHGVSMFVLSDPGLEGVEVRAQDSGFD